DQYGYGEVRAPELIERINNEILNVTTKFEELRHAIVNAEKTISARGAQIDAIAAMLTTLRALRFEIPDLEKRELAELSAAIGKLRVTAVKNPASALQEAEALGARLSGILDVLGALHVAAGDDVPKLLMSMSELSDKGIESAWIDAAIGEIVRNAGSEIRKGVSLSGKFVATAFAGLRNHVEDVCIVQLDVTKLRTRGDDLGARVREKRREYADRFGVPPERFFVDIALDVDGELADLRRLLDSATAPLSQGDANAAAAIGDVAERRLDSLGELVSRVENGVSNYESLIAEAAAALESQQALLSQGEQVLATLVATYDEPSLRLDINLKEGGTVSVSDNLDEARRLAVDTRKLLERGRVTIEDGSVLSGVTMIEQAAKSARQMGFRLEEIRQLQTYLEQLELEIESLVTAATNRFHTLGDIERWDISGVTAAEWRSVGSGLLRLSESRAAKPRATVYCRRIAGELASRVEKLASAIDSDSAAAEKAKAQFEAQASAIERVTKELETVARDGGQKSTELVDLRAELAQIVSLRASAKEALTHPQGDWDRVRKQVSSITNAIATLEARIRKERALLEEALSAIRAAARRIDAANRWTSSHDIQIGSGRGNNQLQQANDALLFGLYAQAAEHAEQAERAAARAISNAESAERTAQLSYEASRRPTYHASRDDGGWGSSSYGDSGVSVDVSADVGGAGGDF
ncbi:MAG: hypothetical protein IT290_07920, partial [Deltaproteobacteria bacterium]|nr:hypothetical protein [Deltaproteobacteria bacterium]